mmetsp:Transcript_937/g.3424  ORF Transcript_937/g.3424 Transcript_937/m.3424 type:complete len:269 (+) Transcript_937:2903-3709(+)
MLSLSVLGAGSLDRMGLPGPSSCRLAATSKPTLDGGGDGDGGARSAKEKDANEKSSPPALFVSSFLSSRSLPISAASTTRFLPLPPRLLPFFAEDLPGELRISSMSLSPGECSPITVTSFSLLWKSRTSLAKESTSLARSRVRRPDEKIAEAPGGSPWASPLEAPISCAGHSKMSNRARESGSRDWTSRDDSSGDLIMDESSYQIFRNRSSRLSWSSFLDRVPSTRQFLAQALTLAPPLMLCLVCLGAMMTLRPRSTECCASAAYRAL